MIVTVTPNPSVDRTVFVDELARGTVIRGKRSISEPSGKGVNVSLALRAHGHPTVAVLPLGGSIGTQLEGMLTDTGLDFRTVPISDSTRSNISLAEPDGTVTKVNESGPSLTGTEIAALRDTALATGTGAEWLAACGSLPEGIVDDFYTGIIDAAHRLGLKVAVDTSGTALRWSIKAGPDVIKPNREELAEAANRAPVTLGEAVDAALRLRDKGARAVLASLGPDGAVLADHEGVLHAEAPVTRPLSTVGAGDALLAGFLAGGGHGRDALRTGLRWAATAVQNAGTLLAPTDNEIPVILHDRIDANRELACT